MSTDLEFSKSVSAFSADIYQVNNLFFLNKQQPFNQNVFIFFSRIVLTRSQILFSLHYPFKQQFPWQ